MQYIHKYKSPIGNIICTSDGNYLTGMWFDGQRYARENISGEYEKKNLRIFAEVREWLDIYFAGEIPDFTPPILLNTTDFRREVYNILMTIPYGETLTYGQIANQIARQRGIARMSAQAVGGAVGHNPVAIIIPCHRVVGSDGSLIGYAGGIEKKIKLLSLEGIRHVFYSDISDSVAAE